MDDTTLLIDLKGAGELYFDGAFVPMPSKKARAIISILALSPNNRLPRSLLCDKLWSDRSQAQASQSLRTELHRLRKCHSGMPEILQASDEYVALERDKFQISFPEPGETLLAGLDIRDDEFEDWLRQERASHEARMASARDALWLNDATADLTQGVVGVGILNCLAVGEFDQGLVVADFVSDLIARELRNFGIAEIFDYRHKIVTADDQAVDESGLVDLFMQVSVQAFEQNYFINCKFFDSLNNKQLWSGYCKVETSADYIESVEFRRFVNEIVDAALYILKNPAFVEHSERRSSSKLALAAINETLKGRHGNLRQAEDYLQRAYEIDRRSVYLGWQTHIVAYLLGERLVEDPEEYRNRLEQTLAHAEEQGRFNPVTLALVAHTHSFVFRNYSRALDIFERMFQLNPMQAICFDLAAVTNVYVDNGELAYEQSSLALNLGQFSQYIYCIHTTHTMACVMSNRFEEAVRYGYRAIEMKPTFTANLRYLIAALVRIGDMDRALEVFAMLLKIEPDVLLLPFESELYPIAGVKRDTVAECLAMVARLYVSRRL